MDNRDKDPISEREQEVRDLRLRSEAAKRREDADNEEKTRAARKLTEEAEKATGR